MSAIQISNGKIGDKPIIRAWESFTGWYWFATEKAYQQDSVIKGKVYKNDQIWFGFVVGFESEWGYFSQKELELNYPSVWELSMEALKWVSMEVKTS